MIQTLMRNKIFISDNSITRNAFIQLIKIFWETNSKIEPLCDITQVHQSASQKVLKEAIV